MNLVLDDAYEVYKKKNTRTALGEDLLSHTHTHTHNPSSPARPALRFTERTLHDHIVD